MAPTASLFYSWDEDEDDGTPRPVTLDCLLPTGVIVPLRVDKDNTLAEIKEVLFYSIRFLGHFYESCYFFNDIFSLFRDFEILIA